MAANVADGYRKSIAHGNVVEIVATSSVSGNRSAADIETARGLPRNWKELLLDLPGQEYCLAQPLGFKSFLRRRQLALIFLILQPPQLLGLCLHLLSLA